jgi:hypothetical protein
VSTEIVYLKAIIQEMRAEHWYPRSREGEDKLASLLIRAYEGGATSAAKLKAYAAIAARLHYFAGDDKIEGLDRTG